MTILGTIRGKIGRFVALKLEERARNTIIRKYPDLWLELNDYLAKSVSTGCEFGDYLILYESIKKYKPKFVLECGSGVTTVVISQALLENSKEGNPGKVVSLEENEMYHKHLLSILPNKYLDFAEIHLRRAVEKTRDMFRGVGYENIPKYDYDFVLVDGPDYMMKPHLSPLVFNFDLIEVVEMSSGPVRAILDTRTSTALVYFLVFGDKFRYDYIRRLGFVGPVTKEDLPTMRQIVARFMKSHPFKRPKY